jgi:cytochrome c biogenesis protein CcmG/thiol:disulfide interchange protein DsbE
MRPTRLLAIAAALLVLVTLGTGLLLSDDGTEARATGLAVPVDQRRAAPELDGDVLVPPRVRLADLRGTPVVINFWASWCVPCRKEAGELARFDREMRARAQLVGVDLQDVRADALAFVREFGWRFPNVRDPQGELATRYAVAGLPTTYVLDAEGRIAGQHVGAQTFEKLVRALEEVEE